MGRAGWLLIGVLAAALAGCAGSGPPAPLAIATSGPCAGIPVLDRNAPPDSLPLTPDPTLEQALPTQVDNQPVIEVSSGRYIETLCMLGGDASLVAALGSAPAGVDINLVNVASASATVEGQRETISAYRLPGGSGEALIPVIGILSAPVGGRPKFIADLGESDIGGKQVTTWTDAADGATSYLYSTGDTLFVVDDVTASQAGKVLATLP